ncbi:quinone oxidoreductase family protein [Pseudomonas aeruginosa]|uniref:quinone oxidoreductase family protein n=1 Tax=Pseudomonas aeruginosa TaxID=287 RepID=UPI0009415802|nr:quinone oxidoreductase [Pseudomonas aeruginosa]
MAKRIQFAAYGGPEVLEYRDYQPAEPGPREVRVRNRAIGLNFIDTYYRSGLYPAPGLPSGLGSEGAGEVEAVGSEVTRFKVGDRVAYATGPLGAYSELHVLAEEKLVHLPDGIDFEQAAAVMLKGLTTQYLLRQTYELRGGETILFHAAAGGVGLFACQWAKALGVQLIGTVSSPEKARLARQHGAWETIDYSHENVGSYADTPEKLQAMADELFGLIERGDIRIEINQRFALAEAARAHTELAARRTTGSTVLLP